MVFGYIRVSKPELRMKEYDMYKALYCSLCRRLGKEYGFFARFALSYDFTFSALLETSLADNFEGTEKKRCGCNPFKSCNYCKDETPFSISAASVIILSYYKFCDDIKDEKGIKKLLAFLLKMLISGYYKKAKKRYNEVDKIAKEYIESQNIAENQKEMGDLDSAAEPSSVMLSQLLSLIAKGKNNKKVLFFLGRLLGRYIYIMDCLCDYDKDKKKNAFNPLTVQNRQEAVERAKTQLYIIINEAQKTFELLEVKRFKNILGNIIYVGLEDTLKYELKKMGAEK